MILSATFLQDCGFLCRKVSKISTRFRSCGNGISYVSLRNGLEISPKNQHWKTYSTFASFTRTLVHYEDGTRKQMWRAASKRRFLTPVMKQNVMECYSHVPSHRNISTASIVNACPESVQPYLKLIRFDKPIGTWLLYLPCTWSIAMATDPGCLVDVKMLALFGIGALVMRGAGCTINDMWDSDFDKKVARTKMRPLPSGQITHFQALVFLGAQLCCGLAILLSLNNYSIIIGASSMSLVVTYPLMKRITHWPQIVLGLAMNWGVFVGWSAVKGGCDWSVCLPLYMAGFFWTMLYDTIYAHQDKSDDAKIGIKSTAILFDHQTKFWLSAFSTGMVASLAVAGMAAHQSWPYFTGIGLTAAHLAWQVIAVDVNKPEDCLEKFKTNKWLGMLIFGAILSGTLVKRYQDEPSQKNNEKQKCKS